ncbi:IS5 family transposase [Alicyclobacillus fastidiosus]|uniref:IS5 family transposase n=3 Tax=Alicyclobacillus fastidiosus TaxID=392011 RepID=A0ABY6ZLR9_9BACL|nr:IS5 family transposase [Alicyclobacillus fastidiosus]WAH43809.1 IS5 family transposase [Alicyclobacillus fastidiosus]WAH44130.1 IS5 family transposase [Alicyclobacillus fastidiosus]WEH10609.1 IS5 family transposase [Alicyclobacillus fastidiosus]GMA60037.1 transposase [Alicyclobacillus fastidiosus]GMA60431.1 transposase [Alicyclobacillus fastidiosus]
MYANHQDQQILPGDFFLPFGGRLREDNRWVELSYLIPWRRVEQEYSKHFSKDLRGGRAMSVRMALGALIIQEREGFSDRHLVQHITENPYLQYFLGLEAYQEEPPFDPSLLTYFRKRLGPDAINQVNEWIVQAAREEEEDGDDNGPKDNPPTSSGEDANGRPQAESQEPRAHQGKLILDATCAPADIAYPTDLTLLNTAREKLEDIIDTLHASHVGYMKKPRDRRRQARRDYLRTAKNRKPSRSEIRKAIGRQLRYVARDLRFIEQLAEHTPLTTLSRKQYRDLLVIGELHRQQREMYRTRSHRVDDRIVSIAQPDVRPIVRGKAKANVEFGSKVAISVVDGYAMMEKTSWDSFNEGTTLIESVERYVERFGCYPEAVLADKIYRTRENLRYCKEHGIRLSGPKLGRPPKHVEPGEKQQEREDVGERNAVEGKFGEAKRNYGLGLIRARLRQTSETVIALQLLVMNLEKRLRLLFWLLFGELFEVDFCIMGPVY